MESLKFYGSAGFFLSAISAAGVGAMLLYVLASTEVSLFGFAFVVPIFALSLVMRSIFWYKAHKNYGGKLYATTSILVLTLGFASMIVVLYFASSQTLISPLKDYSGVPMLMLAAVLWSAYSVPEGLSSSRIFNVRLFGLWRMFIPLIVLDASIFYPANPVSYVLPLSFFLVSAFSLVFGFYALKHGFVRSARTSKYLERFKNY